MSMTHKMNKPFNLNLYGPVAELDTEMVNTVIYSNGLDIAF